MNAAWKWSISFLLMTLAVVASYLWLDRPLALFAHDRLKHYDLFENLSYIPKIVTPLALLGFAVIGLYALFGRPLTKLHMVAVLCAASVAVTEAIKFQLKFAFGRTWPETWVRNNPSFIRDHVYGFFSMAVRDSWRFLPAIWLPSARRCRSCGSAIRGFGSSMPPPLPPSASASSARTFISSVT
jgi:hypothetical protein